MEIGTIKEILRAGIQAPSGENCQPWFFQIEGNKIHILNDPLKDTSPYNHRQHSALITHGCLIENIAIASSKFGFDCNIDIFPSRTNRNLVANITFNESSVAPDSLYEAIWQRGTNRKPYQKLKLKDLHRRELNNTISNVNQIIFKLVEDDISIEKLAEVGATNEQIVFENKELHNFLFSHINWTKKEEEEKPGFYIDTLELPPPIKFLFKIIQYWPIVKVLNIIGFSKGVKAGNKKSNQAAAGMGIVGCSGYSDEDYIQIGRAFQRIWLTAAKNGISLQPLTGILFFQQMIDDGATERFQKDQIATINEQSEITKNIFKLKKENVPIMFRIGYGDPPSARTSRFPVEKFIID